MTLATITDETRLALATLAERATGLVTPSLRLGVTGLARAGKTVFITALVHNLIHGGRLPVFKAYASGRVTGAGLQPQPDDAVPRFDYEDHVRALHAVFERGDPGRRYNIGGNAERRNIDVVRALCATLDLLRPRADGRSYAEQIGFVADRPGHDLRYAVDATRIREELGWAPEESFESGLEKTVRWYLANEDWWRPIVAERAADQRRGLAATRAA